jgi:hypothetical protein
VFHYDGKFPSMPIAFRHVRMTYNGLFGATVTLDISDTLTPNDSSESPLYGSRYVGFNFKDADIAYFWVFPTPDVDLATGDATPPATVATQSTPTVCADKGTNLFAMPTAQGAATMLRAKTHYARFTKNGGEIVRHVDYEAQGYGSVTADSLRYVFQGLTDDGCYYVYGYFPITANFLPSGDNAIDPDFEAANAAQASMDGGAMSPRMGAYYDLMRAKIDAHPDSAFSPDLDEIDALIQSIIIN